MTENLPKYALSFGGGRQTTALALMLERGLLEAPKPDVAVFADTGSEPDHVYETVEYVKERISYPLVTASLGNLYDDTIKMIQGIPVEHRGHKLKPMSGYRSDLPLFGDRGGMIKRQCTTNYKIRVIRRTLREFYAPEQPPSLRIVQYLGITREEVYRIKPSGVQYIECAYPLIDARMTAQDCVEWLDKEYPGHPAGKSACYFCPFRSVREWMDIKDRYPELWQKNLELEDRLHRQGMGLLLTKYPGGLKRMAEDDDAQMTLWDDRGGWGNECAGHCGV